MLENLNVNVARKNHFDGQVGDEFNFFRLINSTTILN